MIYLTPQQVSERTGLKYPTVIKWANEGKLPVSKIPSGKKSKYFFPEKEIEAFIAKFRVKVI